MAPETHGGGEVDAEAHEAAGARPRPRDQASSEPSGDEAVHRECLCPTCPTYPEADQGERLAYCLHGDSPNKEDTEPRDCLCEMCEVYKSCKLYGRNYFCLKGASRAEGMQQLRAGDVPAALQRHVERQAPVRFVSAGLDAHGRG